MIVVKIFGGLGNQLFQYYFGVYLSSKLHTNVSYDIQTKKEDKNYTSRKLEISNLNIEFEIISSNNNNRSHYLTNSIPKRIERKLKQIFPFLSNKYYVESSSHKIIKEKYAKDNCYYDGYWQSYKYLMINKDIKYNDILYKYTSFKYDDTLMKIIDRQSVSIHIRRGDYVLIKKNSKIFNTLDLEYYEKAVEYIKSRVINPEFLIFSDDIDWVKANFNSEKFNFVIGNDPSSDMYLMSLCKHNIIANSTFSWWAAWINSNKNKIVISPKKWFIKNNYKRSLELIPDHWIRL